MLPIAQTKEVGHFRNTWNFYGAVCKVTYLATLKTAEQ